MLVEDENGEQKRDICDEEGEQIDIHYNNKGGGTSFVRWVHQLRSTIMDSPVKPTRRQLQSKSLPTAIHAAGHQDEQIRMAPAEKNPYKGINGPHANINFEAVPTCSF